MTALEPSNCITPCPEGATPPLPEELLCPNALWVISANEAQGDGFVHPRSPGGPSPLLVLLRECVNDWSSEIEAEAHVSCDRHR